jgi:uncharacterized protein (DUF1697 family)
LDILPTYISLLRGINVGGQKKIKICELQVLYESLGFNQVKTYIQSGNLVFNSDINNAEEIEKLIEEKIKEVFNLNVSVIVRTRNEFKQIIQRNPFLKEKASERDKLHVTFLLNIPNDQSVRKLNLVKDKDEDYKVIGKEVYLYCPNGYGRTKLTNSIFEAKLNVKATTRNWMTVNKLSKIAEVLK